MKTSNPFFFAALRSRSMFSTVLFSLTLLPTNFQVTPFSLRKSFCGSVITTAVPFLLILMIHLLCLSSYLSRSLSQLNCLDLTSVPPGPPCHESRGGEAGTRGQDDGIAGSQAKEDTGGVSYRSPCVHGS